MRVHLVLTIDTGGMSGREFEVLREDIRNFAKSRVAIDQGVLVDVRRHGKVTKRGRGLSHE